jgi:dsRNA-specific ribonuclease
LLLYFQALTMRAQHGRTLALRKGQMQSNKEKKTMIAMFVVLTFVAAVMLDHATLRTQNS